MPRRIKFGLSELPPSSFKRLPKELRLRVWNYAWNDALDALPPSQELHVVFHGLFYNTNHCCVANGKRFCGKHSPCARYSSTKDSEAVLCMADGYFSLNKGAVPPTTHQSLRNIALACRESRQTFSKYTLCLYDGPWYPETPYQVVYCNPAIDTLVIRGASTKTLPHPNASKDSKPHQALQEFPRNRTQFSQFRKVVSSFQDIEFDYVGSRGVTIGDDSDFEDDYDGEVSYDYDGENELAFSNGFISLLLHCESRVSLYLRPSPRYWPKVYVNETRVEDIKTLDDIKGVKDERMVEEMDELMDHYEEYAIVQNEHYADGGDHWMPKAKALEQVGCYAPSRWVWR